MIRALFAGFLALLVYWGTVLIAEGSGADLTDETMLGIAILSGFVGFFAVAVLSRE